MIVKSVGWCVPIIAARAPNTGRQKLSVLISNSSKRANKSKLYDSWVSSKLLRSTWSVCNLESRGSDAPPKNSGTSLRNGPLGCCLFYAAREYPSAVNNPPTTHNRKSRRTRQIRSTAPHRLHCRSRIHAAAVNMRTVITARPASFSVGIAAGAVMQKGVPLFSSVTSTSWAAS